MSTLPSALAGRVVVEKNGQRFSLPAEQLETAQSRGFVLVSGERAGISFAKVSDTPIGPSPPPSTSPTLDNVFQRRRMSLFEAAKVGPIPGGEEVLPPQPPGNPTQLLPAFGASVGAIKGGVLGAMGGAAAGEAGRQLLDRAMGFPAPKTSLEAGGEITKQAVEQGVIEAAARGTAGLFRLGRSFLFNRVTAREAGKALAEELASGAISPAEFSTKIQSLYSETKNSVGTELRNSLQSALRDAKAANPDLQISADTLLQTIDTEISNIERRLPAMSKEFAEKAQALLSTLRNTRDKLPRLVDGRLVIPNPTPRPAIGTAIGDSQTRAYFAHQDFVPITDEAAVLAINDVKQDFFQAARDTIRGEARRIEKRISSAAFIDLETALGPGGGFEAYKRASTNFRTISELAEADKHKTLARVFGNKRADPDQIAQLMTQVPEDSMRAIELLRSVGGHNELAQTRKAIFMQLLKKERSAFVNELLLDDAKVRAVFGPRAKQVQAFARAIEEAEFNKAGGGAVRRAVSFISVPVGNVFRGTAPIRVGVNDATGTILEIPAKRLAEFLDNPAVFAEFTKAMSSEPSGAAAANLIRALSEAAQKQLEDR